MSLLIFYILAFYEFDSAAVPALMLQLHPCPFSPAHQLPCEFSQVLKFDLTGVQWCKPVSNVRSRHCLHLILPWSWRFNLWGGDMGMYMFTHSTTQSCQKQSRERTPSLILHGSLVKGNEIALCGRRSTTEECRRNV